MIKCNKEEAFRVREIAIKKMESNDFVAARKSVLEAQRLFPELEGISHLLSVCDVHCAAVARVKGAMDWYGIFQVKEAADNAIIRRQYLNLIRSLHPDRNRFPGAEAAFKLVSEAYSFLYEPTKRYKYDIKTGRNTFWTKCPFCQTRYEYYIRFLNKRVRCQLSVCRRNFFASALEEQAMPTSSSVAIPVKAFRTRKRDTCSQQGHYVKPPSAGQVADVEVQFSTLNQDKSSVPIENENTHAMLMPYPPDPNMVGTHNSGVEDAFTLADALNVPSSAKHSSAGGKADRNASTVQSAMMHERDGVPMKDNDTGGRSMPYPADSMVVNLENLGSVKDAEVLSAAAETSKRKQDADPNTSLNSDSNKRQMKNDSPSAHVDTCCKQIYDDNATSVGRQQALPTCVSSEANIKEKVKNTGTGDQDTHTPPEQDTTLQENAHGANQLFDEHLGPFIHIDPDPQFHRFEEDRSREMFERGQIWALYDQFDALPKFYGWISKVETEPFAVHVIWLDPCPQQEQEISISCGTFRVLNQRAQYNTTSTFSHLVDAKETGVPCQFEILPQVGEVWAVYMNSAPDWAPSSIDACELAVGEVIERTEACTKLSLLAKVTGYVAVFKPDKEKLYMEIPAAENSRFSHLVPSFRLTEEEEGALRGFFELDPASIPYYD